MPDLGWGGEIAGGMSAGLDWSSNYGTNHAPHPLLVRGNAQWPVVRAGYMVTVIPPASDAPFKQYSIKFLYNPSAISSSFMFNPSAIQPMYQPAQGQASTQGLLTGAYVTWDLLFDRTYELSHIPGSNYDPNDVNGPGTLGCLVDYAAMYNMVGALDPGSKNNNGVGNGGGNAGYPVTIPVQVVFGKMRNGKKWGFIGYLTQVDFNFLTFAYDMTPQRMTINCTLQTTFIPSDMGSAGGSPSGPTNSSVVSGQGSAPGMSLSTQLGGAAANGLLPGNNTPVSPVTGAAAQSAAQQAISQLNATLAENGI